MPSLAKDTEGERLTVLQTGESGTGKTIGACSFARDNAKAYVFDIDKRMASVHAFYKKYDPRFLERIFYDGYRTWSDINNKIEGWVKANTMCPYGVIVLSSITSLSRIITSESIALRGENPRPQQGGNDDNALGQELKVGNIPVNSIQDYKAENNGIAMILTKLIYHSNFKNTHIFVDAHLMEWRETDLKAKKAEDKIKIKRKIVTAGKSIAEEIPIYFNEKWVYERGIAQDGGPSFNVKFRGVPEDETDDAPSTCYFGLPNKVDFTGKNLSYELSKYIPIFKEA